MTEATGNAAATVAEMHAAFAAPMMENRHM